MRGGGGGGVEMELCVRSETEQLNNYYLRGWAFLQKLQIMIWMKKKYLEAEYVTTNGNENTTCYYCICYF